MSVFNVKNLIIYRITRDIDFNNIEEQLSNLKYEPCGSLDMQRFGFIPPLGIGNSDCLTHKVNDQMLISLFKEDKMLPTPVINNELNKKIEKLEADQGRKLKKAERQAIKDEVIQELLPRAFSKYIRFDVWVNLTDGFIAALVSSHRRAEDCFAMIRKALGSLPVVPLTMKDPIELTLTEWVRSGQLPKGFVFGEQSEMKAILEEGGIAKYTKQDLISDEIQTNIEAGKLVTKLSLGYEDRVTFCIDDSFVLSKLKFDSAFLETNDDIEREDYNQRFDADFFLIVSELNILIKALIDSLGGEANI
ncbi:recombination-associated protein RdgC [Providencia rettgeri]|uniref:recombination-associated protein RdgC n=2 Tax=Morganellaceae TaxID=1903414 RepID=UPI001FC80F87|nr:MULTISPECIES: recombination-associated protein RdgC [Providencia]EJD6046746.1 recombination-associated protein RdgC [Providencia rettgeri]ELH9583004.1 recombination-associated protein RdgC [Providencia rettgeri]ELM3936616.1 recombination-associated protein RdgC [Providencia rettgeri]ELR5090019.1 recombination-associated protein RdgC [Providencia rettgeri]ELR5105382.1 recombination-associated protein RdgC [Providencia rettgeri]